MLFQKGIKTTTYFKKNRKKVAIFKKTVFKKVDQFKKKTFERIIELTKKGCSFQSQKKRPVVDGWAQKILKKRPLNVNFHLQDVVDTKPFFFEI